MDFNENFIDIKEKLKKVLTTENTEVVTAIDKQLDTMLADHNAVVKKHGELQNAYIDVVKNTAFATPSEENPITPEKSFDDILSDELNKILKERKND